MSSALAEEYSRRSETGARAECGQVGLYHVQARVYTSLPVEEVNIAVVGKCSLGFAMPPEQRLG